MKNLEPIWSYSTGLTKGHEDVPQYHDGILFVVASYDVVFALDARSGKLLWRYDRDVPDKALSVVCCDVVNKGGVLYGDDFIYGTIDAHLVALNAKTGQVHWDTKVTDYAEGTTITNAPVVLHGNIITGMTGGEFGARGFLMAINAETGAIVWKTFTIPGPGEPGNDTWGNSKEVTDTWKHSGGTTWTNGYYDAATDIYWQPTGQPGDLGVPMHLAGLRVQRDQVGVDGAVDEVVTVEHAALVDDVAADNRQGLVWNVAVIPPQELSAAGVQSKHHVVGSDDKQDTVVILGERLRDPWSSRSSRTRSVPGSSRWQW